MIASATFALALAIVACCAVAAVVALAVVVVIVVVQRMRLGLDHSCRRRFVIEAENAINAIAIGCRKVTLHKRLEDASVKGEIEEGKSNISNEYERDAERERERCYLPLSLPLFNSLGCGHKVSEFTIITLQLIQCTRLSGGLQTNDNTLAILDGLAGNEDGMIHLGRNAKILEETLMR